MKILPSEIVSGMRFGRLVAVSEFRNGSDIVWNCVCDCGTERVVVRRCLTSGNTKSCGCSRRESLIRRNTTHGLRNNVFQRAWNHMLSRCLNELDVQYHLYGGRGIKPCEAIRKSPIALMNLLGDKPDGTSMDRIDNDGGYWCGECSDCLFNGYKKNIRWATFREQNINRRVAVMITIGGEKRHVSEWAKISGLEPHVIKWRMKAGWPTESILTRKRTAV
jgi:hypothetical protein